MKFSSLLALLCAVLSSVAILAADASAPVAKNPTMKNAIPEGAEVITLGAGCFWCTEAVFQEIPGVYSVVSGYMGGQTKNPTYRDVCTGTTGHAEVARIAFNPKETSLEKVLNVFWHLHDPTTLNRQGADAGTQYRSAIYYYSDAQKKVAEKSKVDASKEFSDPIVTEITASSTFYEAEDYHQDYYKLNKNKNPYCRMVISPKLKKLGLKE